MGEGGRDAADKGRQRRLGIKDARVRRGPVREPLRGVDVNALVATQQAVDTERPEEPARDREGENSSSPDLIIPAA